MEPYLYIIARNDMQSLGRGKSCAQVAHGANQFIFENYIRKENNKYYNVIKEHYFIISEKIGYWMSSANGFGTTIVLEGNINDINKLHDTLDIHNKSLVFDYMTNDTDDTFIDDKYDILNNYCLHNFVIDPSYPILDGKEIHVVKDVITCYYVFGYKEKLNKFMHTFKLLRND